MRCFAPSCPGCAATRSTSSNAGASRNSITTAFSELWFDSEDDLKAAFASPEGVTLLADLPNFAGDIDPIVSVETQVVWP